MADAKLQFQYSGVPQRSPEWYKLRIGKVSASRLEDWLSVSKQKGKEGKPLKKRLDYEKELMYERQFGVSYNNFISEAMLDGIDFEDFARRQYQKITGESVNEVGCWYNQVFVASPDGVVGDDGLIEIKVLRDSSFSEVLDLGVPDGHWKQIQGQLWASQRTWCEYVAVNLNTKKIKIIRVEPDTEFQEWLELAVPEPLTVKEFSNDGLYDFVDSLPEPKLMHLDSAENSQITKGDWAL